MTGLLDHVHRCVTGWRDPARTFVLGICGAQGSGKTTLAEGLRVRLEDEGVRVAVLSLDDLYLAPEDRPVQLHPLFATRGVPGTHDVAMGIRALDHLKARRAVALPRFDKATDRPVPETLWPVVEAADIVIFEGWCVGAVPQAESDLGEPVNDLEHVHDPDGMWRRHVNTQLAGPYRDLFSRIDRLILLAAPGFEVVHGWRKQQEQVLARTLATEGRAGKIMSDDEIARFIQHYERLTRHILRDMPERADLTVRLDANRGIA